MYQTLSQAGLEFLAQEEGCVLEPYDDSAGNCTIGVGHLLHMGKCDGTERPITYEHAMSLLQADLAWAQTAVRNWVTVPLNQNQFDALVSFTFNVGAQGFGSSNCLRHLNDREYQSAADAMLAWQWAWHEDIQSYEPDLEERRKRERELFLTPVEESVPALKPWGLVTNNATDFDIARDEITNKLYIPVIGGADVANTERLIYIGAATVPANPWDKYAKALAWLGFTGRGPERTRKLAQWFAKAVQAVGFPPL